MSYITNRRGLILFIIFCLFVAGLTWWIVINSPSYQQCICQHRNSDNNQFLEKEFTHFSDIDCWGAFIDINNGSITAIATFLLVIVTGGLIWIGARQENTIRQQLRAYVSITEAKIEMANLDGVVPLDSVTLQPRPISARFCVVSEICYINAGQTPAYDLTVKGDIKIVEWPINAIELIDKSPKGNSHEVIGPTMKRIKFDILYDESSKSNIVLSDADIERLKSGKLAICAFGVISYRDAFKKIQTTNYRFFIGGPIGIRGLGMSAHDEGNEAT